MVYNNNKTVYSSLRASPRCSSPHYTAAGVGPAHRLSRPAGMRADIQQELLRSRLGKCDVLVKYTVVCTGYNYIVGSMRVL